MADLSLPVSGNQGTAPTLPRFSKIATVFRERVAIRPAPSDPLARQAAIENALSMALHLVRTSDTTEASGSIKPGVWTDNQGNTKPTLDMTAHQVLTPYHVQRKRRAVAKDDNLDGRAAKPAAMPAQPDFDDDLNF